MSQATTTNGIPPTDKPKDKRPAYGRPIREIVDDLTNLRPDPKKTLKTKEIKGKQITYLPWYKACDILDWHAPGWSYVIDVKSIGNQVVCIASITIPAREGLITRSATGIEEEEVKGYGDPSSNAESMALRRAAAKFGLARYLYEK